VQKVDIERLSVSFNTLGKGDYEVHTQNAFMIIHVMSGFETFISHIGLEWEMIHQLITSSTPSCAL